MKAVEDLECRVKQQLEDNVMRQVNDIKVKISQNCEKLSLYELHQVAV